MQSLIRFLLRYHFLVLFIVLELVSFGIVVAHHKDGGRFLNSASTVAGGLYGSVDAIFGYVNLKQENKELAEHNAKLINASMQVSKVDTSRFWREKDLVYSQHYEYMAATVINSTVHKYRNFITIDKGKKHGVTRDMAVITGGGTVGTIVDVSNNFSLAISLLNVDGGTSAKFKHNNFVGSVSWNGHSPEVADFSGIPSHAVFENGDTVMTSGYSSIFPEGIMVGTVLSFQRQAGRKLYDITIKFSEDFANLKEVYLVKNLMKDEQLKLEEEADK